MAKVAIREYALTQEQRQSIVDKALALLKTDNARTQLAAGRLLLAADSLDIQREALASKQPSSTTTVNIFDRAQVLLQQLQAGEPLTPQADNLPAIASEPASE
jgi:hypothetical protein